MSPEELERFERRWTTAMGTSYGGDRVVLRGKDLLNGLRGMRWMAQYLYAITGRFFSDAQVRLFEGIWSLSVSYPDSRVWPNRVAALAATARSSATLAASGALAVSEGELFGHRTNIRTIDFLIRLRRRVEGGEALKAVVMDELGRNRWIPGYGRPLVNGDERIAPLLQFAESLGFVGGRHVRLALEVNEVLRNSRYRMEMNIAALDAALAADQGLSPREYHHYFMLSFIGGIVPCALDGGHGPEGAFFPLRCESLRYDGPPRRGWAVD